jgi:hypothetical protein
MKKNIKFRIILTTLFGVFPATFVYASPLIDSGSTVSDLIYNVMGVFDSLIPLLIGAAVVVFLYGVLLFIAKASAGNAEGRKEGINFMIFGIIGIAVMVSVWGLVAFVTNTFGTTGGVPQFNDQAF